MSGIYDAEEFETVHQQPATGFIDILHRVHLDNSQLQYYAKGLGRKQQSTMPLTPFIFEFFLFNSLYQVDWVASAKVGVLIHHPEVGFREGDKQKQFFSYIKDYAEANPAQLYRAFEPLMFIERAEGAWTKIHSGARVSKRDGERFFQDIGKLQTLLEKSQQPSDFPTNEAIFQILSKGCRFVYMVRNNIFHGAKTLLDASTHHQKRRIEVYELFLRGITSLFFLAEGKSEAACDYVPCPVFSSSLVRGAVGEAFDRISVLEATDEKMMKIGDSRLITRFTKTIIPPAGAEAPNQKAALFYPSADTDFLTPMFLGLPYCTQFYFFERSKPRGQLPPLARLLRRLVGRKMAQQSRWVLLDNKHCLDFEFNGIPRRVHWVHTDNKTIFDEDVELNFYFHRGDSPGEGGSGQNWDSALLPELVRQIPTGSTCLYLTDGMPGGFDGGRFSDPFELTLPFIERGRDISQWSPLIGLGR